MSFANTAKAEVRSCLNYTNKQIVGTITFEKVFKGTRVHGEIKGLTPGKHGFHIHESNDLSKGCESLGSHYNPTHHDHSSRMIMDPKGHEEINEFRHVGDLGNLIANDEGIARIDFIDPLLKIEDIIDRSIIVHEKEDDLGTKLTEDSKKTGSSGARIGYGIIRKI